MDLTENSISIPKSEKISLQYLFYTFFKIGCVSFGGYMALVSLVQKIMVDKDETLENEVIIDSITVASLIPGPLAVNIVANIGYHLKGKKGAVISMFAVLLPACTLMLFLAWLYFTYAYKVEWGAIMHYVVAVVSAIILSTGFNLYKKEIGKNYRKVLLCLAAIVVMSVTNSYIITIGCILAGAIAGLFMDDNRSQGTLIDKEPTKFKFNTGFSVLISLFAINELLFLTNVYRYFNSDLLKLGLVFSGISLTLFGGGYVMIPIMQTLFVNELHWLTRQEFIDAIAFSQATPGPILVSATFIGYKIAGLAGAVIATIAMFAPSAVLMIMVSKLFKKTKDHSLAKHMIGGIKVVVIGLIIASAGRLLYQQQLSVLLILVAVAALILSFKYKVSPVYLIGASIFIGLITKYLI
jgi:chromate transporter